MSSEVWANANVTTPSAIYSRVRAIIYKDRARLLDNTGEAVAEMIGSIQVTDNNNSASWTNGVETWSIENAGCSCHG